MIKNTDWEPWDSEFGPRSHLEACQLKTVADGAERSGPFTGKWSFNKKAWFISRDADDAAGRPEGIGGDVAGTRRALGLVELLGEVVDHRRRERLGGVLNFYHRVAA